MMAAAEARAAWQRTANRCFVQEDAKRAPKLACCPSASSSSKQVDAGPASGTDGLDNPIVGFIPLHKKSSYSDLPSDSRWWLHMQPNYVHQRDFINEQLNCIEAQMETNRVGVVSSTSKLSEVRPQCRVDGILVGDNMSSELSFDTHSVISATLLKKDPEVRQQELKAMYCKNAQEPIKLEDVGKSCELIEMEPIDCSVSKETDDLCFNLDSPWIVGTKTEPWWRATDRNELASLVAQRSLDLIENCDLPQPQKTNVKRDLSAHLDNIDYNGILPSSMGWKAQGRLSDQNVHAKGHPTSGYAYGREWASVEVHAQYNLDKQISDCTSHKGMTETQISESDASKAQLLEALRHSQTRAREAENAAKQAYAEKEHIIKLFFRQASHLFAYKQWFQLLQLENLCFQLKNSQQPISTLIPAVLPWVPYKTRKHRKSWRADSRGRGGGKQGRPRYDGSKLAVAVALGLGLVGAGLLLGWTVGWMFPTL